MSKAFEIQGSGLFEGATSPSNMVDLLRLRALDRPDQQAFTFLTNGEVEAASLTYGELDRRARMIGALLQRHGAAGDRALLIYPPGLDFITAFFGCLYAGLVAVPVYPPQPGRSNRALPRLRGVLDSARPALALTTEKLRPTIEDGGSQTPMLPGVKLLATDLIAYELSGEWSLPPVNAETLAFLQYTSGSTAAPRGVMVTHGNLIHNQRMIEQAFAQTKDSIIVGWLPLYHDMGLIGNVLHTVYLGARCVLMSPVDFLQSPIRWLQAISRYRATASGGPNFAYDLCARRITAEQRATLDLSSWRVAFNGAEPVRTRSMEQFTAAFTSCGFSPEAWRPCYGLAEATLLVSAHSQSAETYTVQKSALRQGRAVGASSEDPDGQAQVGCGRSHPDQQIAIVNPETEKLCLPGEVGEIWVSGPSVARGYWDRPEETEEVFQARMAGHGTGAFLRTGDLGFTLGGELFVTGRLKDLIIIRGHNHYPQDIELTVEESHPALRPGCGAAFSVEIENEEQLVIVHEIERKHRKDDLNAVVESIRRAVAEKHELHVRAVALIKTGSIPKTSSGKIQRHACKANFLAEDLEVVYRHVSGAESFVAEADAPEHLPIADTPPGIESKLQALIARALGVAPSSIDPRRELSALGLDSLMAIELTHAVETGFGVTLPLANFLDGSNITRLADQIVDGSKERSDSSLDARISPLRTSDAHPLTSGQRALWFLHRLAPENAAYNIAQAVRITSDLDVSALRRAFQRLVDRHSALRATFVIHDGNPRQQIHESAEVCFQTEDASNWSEDRLNARLEQEASRPFNLESGPLMRAFLFKRQGREQILLFAVHHIIADLWSLVTLVHELGVFYAAEISETEAGLAPPPLQFADIAYRQADMLNGPEGERLRNYWEGQLAGELPTLSLPTDRPRPPVQTYAGAVHYFTLDAGMTERLTQLSRASGATVYMTLLAAFEILLSRYTGQEEILVGSPLAGRSRAAWAGLVGYFVNPVVLRGDLAGNPTFITFLNQVRQNVLGALTHQDYPFSLLVERKKFDRDPSRSPLFQVMFVYQQAPIGREKLLNALALDQPGVRLKLGELSLESMKVRQPVAQFDLSLALAEVEGELAATIKYSADLFDAATISRFARHYQRLLESLTANPHERLATLPFLDEAEQHQLLVTWNETKRSYQEKGCIHELFESRVERTPDAVAVIAEGERLNYRELNSRANQLAHHLRKLGVGPDVLVPICVERSLEMVIGLLAILKSGGAYVPLDPSYPIERLKLMLEDLSAPVFLTQERLLGGLPVGAAQALCLDTQLEMWAHEREDNPLNSVQDENLAYAIFTSGSTGRPKGAMNSHRGIRNRLLWMQSAYRLTEADGVLQKTPFSFDVSVWEFFWPLMTGARLVMARPGGHQDSAYLVKLIVERQITTLHFVPSMLQTFLREKGVEQCRSVKRVICSGEALPFELQERFFASMDAELHNLYGPTEAAIDVTFHKCERASGQRIVPIGRPIANTRLYVLDQSLQPVPGVVPGELYLGGANLARGYLNHPDLTAEKFIPDPFGGDAGERLYRTGDLVRYLPDGNVEFLNRIDRQVKIRGNRIELGEIETALNQHPAVIESVVAVWEDLPVGKRLVAYVVTHEGEQPTTRDFRGFLSEKLPEYMVPSVFTPLATIPLTPNGKIDRQKLPAPRPGNSEIDTDYAGPRTPVEEALAAIWAETLGLERVGIHDNFFELGGHSLLMTQIASRIHDHFHIEMPLAVFLQGPTVAEVSIAVTQAQAADRDEDDISRLLDELENLSLDEMELRFERQMEREMVTQPRTLTSVEPQTSNPPQVI